MAEQVIMNVQGLSGLDIPMMGVQSPIIGAHPYAPILVLILAIIGFVATTLVLTHLIGPKRKGTIKDSTYESGMPIIGDARSRFNVRFYVVDMMFLLFDVEIVLLWPWVLAFYDAAMGTEPLSAAAMQVDKGLTLGAIAVFFAILAIGYIYDLGKGVFRWVG